VVDKDVSGNGPPEGLIVSIDDVPPILLENDQDRLACKEDVITGSIDTLSPRKCLPYSNGGNKLDGGRS
jgi:hypothetical protein